MLDLIEKGEYYSVWAKGNFLYGCWASKMQIGYPELMILYALKTMGTRTQKNISEDFGLLKQTVNTVIRDLLKKEYITLIPSESDKREKNVSLTEKGKDYADKIIEPLLCAEDRVCKKLGYERIEQLHDTMVLYNILFEKEINNLLVSK